MEPFVIMKFIKTKDSILHMCKGCYALKATQGHALKVNLKTPVVSSPHA